MRRHRLPCAVLMSVLVLAATPAWAHVRAPRVAVAEAPVPIVASAPESISAAAPEVGVPWLALLLLGAVVLAAVGRHRRLAGLTLVAILAVLAFETGVHSTHHLGRADDATHCPVASLSVQLSADLVDVGLDATLVPASSSAAALPFVAPAVDRSIAPDVGRGPPALSA